MDQNPLTDPTSLIAYRLANGASSLHPKRARYATRKTRAGSAGIVALGILIVALIAITLLML